MKTTKVGIRPWLGASEAVLDQGENNLKRKVGASCLDLTKKKTYQPDSQKHASSGRGRNKLSSPVGRDPRDGKGLHSVQTTEPAFDAKVTPGKNKV